ncbi:DNA polymerase III subunit epsilon [Gammaproteobacteria bacterium]
METLVIIDFETTGLSPGQGDRATEIAAIVLQDRCIVRRYQSLMNAGVRVPPFITEFTGITNEMVRRAPPAALVMNEVADFVGDLPIVAHNASFDQKFWEAELALIRRTSKQPFACSMLAARRLYPDAPNHKLGTLATFARLPNIGKAHRAMVDAEITTHLLNHMEDTVAQRFQIQPLSHAILRHIQRAKVTDLENSLQRLKLSLQKREEKGAR